jgi:hypothetical protein
MQLLFNPECCNPSLALMKATTKHPWPQAATSVTTAVVEVPRCDENCVLLLLLSG